MSEHNCMVCGSDKIKHFSLAGWNFFSCGECKITYLKAIPSDKQVNEFYQTNYKITSDYYIETEYRRIFRIPEQIYLIKEISTLKDKPAKLLDIGCDKGYFLDEARRYGYDVVGVEPSVAARQYCENLKIDCYAELSEIKEKQDIAVMWHSLEHHINPQKTLKEINEKLNENGLIFIRVPDFQCIYRKIFGKKWIWFQPDRHYWHFSKDSISILLQNSGFDLIKVQSRKPNNRITKKMNNVSKLTFKKNFAFKQSLKKRFGRIYEDLTGIEVFAVGRKKS